MVNRRSGVIGGLGEEVRRAPSTQFQSEAKRLASLGHGMMTVKPGRVDLASNFPLKPKWLLGPAYFTFLAF